jgi:GNAT superfamily N-acetyltransferase
MNAESRGSAPGEEASGGGDADGSDTDAAAAGGDDAGAAGDDADAGRPGDAFPRPPVTFTDGEGRTITVRAYDGGFEALVAMYVGFDPEHRAQGIPPQTEGRIREWLRGLVDDGLNAVAVHDGDPVGHATLVPMGDGRHELAIFVAGPYQHAGIGSRLLRTLLGYGAREGVERVWLTVRRGNRVALNLYESVGFETLRRGREYEMELAL